MSCESDRGRGSCSSSSSMLDPSDIVLGRAGLGPGGIAVEVEVDGSDFEKNQLEGRI
jgi:hypothetical protein